MKDLDFYWVFLLQEIEKKNQEKSLHQAVLL